MKTYYYTDPSFWLHRANDGHPENPERLTALHDAVMRACDADALPHIHHIDHVTSAHDNDLLQVHTQHYIDHIRTVVPNGQGLVFLDDETVLCAHSQDSAMHAVGAVLHAVDTVINTQARNAFCAVRPPGHHAHRNHALGFCVYNNAAIAAKAALDYDGIARVAILDIDAHHGDGIVDCIGADAAIFYASTFQDTLDGHTANTHTDRLIAYGFPAHTTGHVIVDYWHAHIMPHIRTFKPDMIIVCAGFDGHNQDPLAQLDFVADDYARWMRMVMDLAHDSCNGRCVAMLEGGYDTDALAKCVLAFLQEMNTNDR